LTDPTFRYVYGTDQLGNVWRLDMGTTTGATPTVTKITTLLDKTGTGARAQPITTKPILTHIGTDRVLFIGTGRYLGTPDLSDGGAGKPAWQQSFYAFKDKDYTGNGINNLRSNTTLLKRELSKMTGGDRGIVDPSVAMNWSSRDGWYMDFNPVFSGTADSPGEGINLVDPRLILGTIFFTTNVPATGTANCTVGGRSFNYNLDFRTGLAIEGTNGVVGSSLGGTITVGVAIVQLPDGSIKAISTGANTIKTTSNVATSTSGL